MAQNMKEKVAKNLIIANIYIALTLVLHRLIHFILTTFIAYDMLIIA